MNSVSPGWIETRDWQYSPRAETPVHPERDRLQHPVGRVGKPEDIAEALDGGMTVKMIYEE